MTLKRYLFIAKKNQSSHHIDDRCDVEMLKDTPKHMKLQIKYLLSLQ